LTAPSLRLALEAQDNGGEETHLQVRWSGSYTRTSLLRCLEPLPALAEKFHRALDQVETAAAGGGNGRRASDAASCVDYIHRLGTKLATRLGLPAPVIEQAQPWPPIRLELETRGGVDSLPLEILPWADGPVGLQCGVSRTVQLDHPGAFNTHHLGPFSRALIVTTAKPAPALQLESEVDTLVDVFEKMGIKTMTWQADIAYSAAENIRSLCEQMNAADIVHIAGHTTLGTDGLLSFQLDGSRHLNCTPSDLLGVRKMPRLVWMNTCHSAHSAPLESFAARFLAGGALAYIGTGARLEDLYIKHACRRFYAEALHGACLAEAMRQARVRLCELNSTSWAVLRLYGQGHLVIHA